MFFFTISFVFIGSKSDAALVTVVFGVPEKDSQAEAWQNNGSLLAGVIIGAVIVLLLCTLGVVFCVRARRAQTKSRRQQQYSNSFDVLQYAPFRGIDNASHRVEGSNHYHDPAGGPAGTRIVGSDASVSSGRGSADDDGVINPQDSGHYYTGNGKKSRRCFPLAMPDSGLPDEAAEHSGDYFTKVAIPASVPGSHESIHRFDDEAGGEEKYFHHPADQERRSHGSSSNSSVFERQQG